MVAPAAGWPTTLWPEEARAELGHSTASPEVATRGRARHARKKMSAGNRVRASKFSPPQLLWWMRAEFLPRLRCIQGDRAALSRGEMESRCGASQCAQCAVSESVSAQRAPMLCRRAQECGRGGQRGCVCSACLCVCLVPVCACVVVNPVPAGLSLGGPGDPGVQHGVASF